MVMMTVIKLTQFDENLNSIRLSRKHIPRDATSLFRCFAESVFRSQAYHPLVRSQCIDYIQNNREFAGGFYGKDVSQTLIHLADDETPGSLKEMQIMAHLYDREIWAYFEGNIEPVIFGNKGSKTGLETNIVRICCSSQTHFDLIITGNLLENLAITQSIVYEMLYNKIFGYEESEIEDILSLMLKEKFYARLKSKRRSLGTQSGDLSQFKGPTTPDLKDAETCESNETVASDEDLAAELLQRPPFPYKVAKALDVNLYRNVHLDVWLSRHNQELKANCAHVNPGDKFRVSFHEGGGHFYNSVCYVQDVIDGNRVRAFVEQLGQLMVLNISDLQALQTRRAQFKKKSRAANAANSGEVRMKSDYRGSAPVGVHLERKPEVGRCHQPVRIPLLNEGLFSPPSYPMVSPWQWSPPPLTSPCPIQAMSVMDILPQHCRQPPIGVQPNQNQHLFPEQIKWIPVNNYPAVIGPHVQPMAQFPFLHYISRSPPIPGALGAETRYLPNFAFAQDFHSLINSHSPIVPNFY